MQIGTLVMQIGTLVIQIVIWRIIGRDVRSGRVTVVIANLTQALQGYSCLETA